MSDPLVPTPPAPAAVPPAVVTPPVAAPVVTPPVAAAPAPVAPVAAPPAPPYVNPWASRPLPPRAAAPTPAPTVAAPITAPAAPPAAATPAPAEDPRLAALTSTVDNMRGVLALTAARELNTLPENVRAYVLAQAGDDPATQIRTLEGMRNAGLVTAPTQVIPPGATTLPTQAAPAPASSVNPDAVALTTYEALKAKSPQSAAAYLLAHSPAIGRARAARPS